MNRIKELRKVKNMTVVDLAKSLNMPQSTLTNYENGVREPKLETWQLIANFFNVSIDYLTGREKRCTNNLKKLREERQLSLGDLSKELSKKGFKIGRASLNNYEREEQTPKQETWKILADYFKVSVPYMMGIDNPKGENEVVISAQEYERLKEIERKYNEIKSLIID